MLLLKLPCSRWHIHTVHLSAHLKLEPQHATTSPAQAEAVAGGADSVWEVSRSQLAGPGRPLHLSLILHIHNWMQKVWFWSNHFGQQTPNYVTCSMLFYCILFYSQDASSKSRGNMPLAMAGVLTEMLHSSGVGPCTLVGAPHKYKSIYQSEALCLTTRVMSLHVHTCLLMFWCRAM